MKTDRREPHDRRHQGRDALNMLSIMLTDPDVEQKDWYANAVELPDGGDH